MKRYFYICLDGVDAYEEWGFYVVDEENGLTEKIMFEDVRAGLKELGGGHADIFDEETDELYGEIEV